MSLPQPDPGAEPTGPPYERWAIFWPRFSASWAQGQHCLFNGPTGSGKTVAARVMARRRRVVVVLGTKPRDGELDAYIAEGYTRVETWPPPPRALRPLEDGSVRIVLWPKIVRREDLYRHRPAYVRCLDQVFVEGEWTLVADEGLWLCKSSGSRKEPRGLDLADQLEAIAYAGRSSRATLLMVIQRPAGVPRNTWSNASHAFIWHAGVTSDQRELASLGTRRPREVQDAIQRLRGHQFLYLPLRAGGDWRVSQVDL